MSILKYKNLKIEYEEYEHCEMLGSYDLEISIDLFNSITCKEDIQEDELDFISFKKEKVIFSMADIQIKIFNLLLVCEEEVELSIKNLGNLYWIFHDLLHAEEDIDWVESRQQIPSYIEVERLVDAIPLLEKEGGSLIYNEIKEILESAEDRLESRDLAKLKEAFEEHLEEEVFL